MYGTGLFKEQQGRQSAGNRMSKGKESRRLVRKETCSQIMQGLTRLPPYQSNMQQDIQEEHLICLDDIFR